MEKEEQKLEEQEAEETTPLVRKSRNGDDSKIVVASPVDGEVGNGVSESNGHALLVKVAQNGAENEEIIEERDGSLELESESINGEPKLEESDGALILHDRDEVKEQIFKGPEPAKFNISETKGSYEPSKEIESAEEFEAINEDDIEIAEADVERVIQKQTTHDLYCPNCKSCITKRVILRKRKRRTKIPYEHVKRNESGTAASTQSAEHQEGEVGIDENGFNTEPDVFRCLSCFSFFIPTGDGFKLFRNKWFTNIFAANKNGTAVEQGVEGTAGIDNDHENGKVTIGDGGKLDMKATTEAVELDRNKTRPFPNLRPPVNWKHASGARDKLDTQATEFADKEIIQHSPPSSSLIQASDEDGKMDTSVSIPQEKQDAKATVVTKSVLHKKNADPTSSDSGEIRPAEEPIKTESSSALLDAQVAEGNDSVITIDRQTAAAAAAASARVSGCDGGEGKIEVIKSIVYGGLAEAITSLSVVSSAVGGGAATLNVLALAAANLIGGLCVISHNLWDLRCDHDDQVLNQNTEQKDLYKQLLGRRQNFLIHCVVAVLSYLVFGLVSPLVYGFTFRQTDDKQLKLAVAAAASLVCILTLAVAKAYVQAPPRPYLKTVSTFLVLGFVVSGVSYAAGHLVELLLEKLGLFGSTSVAPNLVVQEMRPLGSGWASY